MPRPTAPNASTPFSLPCAQVHCYPLPPPHEARTLYTSTMARTMLRASDSGLSSRITFAGDGRVGERKGSQVEGKGTLRGWPNAFSARSALFAIVLLNEVDRPVMIQLTASAFVDCAHTHAQVHAW
jgi:hypothetical protein